MKRANSLLTGLALLDSIDYVRLKSVKCHFSRSSVGLHLWLVLQEVIDAYKESLFPNMIFYRFDTGF